MSHWLSIFWGLGYHFGLTLFAIHVVMKRRSVGVTLSWLVLLFALPVAGVVCYLMFGTRRLSSIRTKCSKDWYPAYFNWRNNFTKVVYKNNIYYRSDMNKEIKHRGVYRLSERTMGLPALSGNKLCLYHTDQDIIVRLIEDIRNAKKSIVMAFYILEPQGRMKNFVEVLLEAANRGVKCLVLLDSVGSRQFLKSAWVMKFKEAGINIIGSLPVGIWRLMCGRMDIRNHRKILMVDDQIAWTGSFNLVDPVCFNQNAHVGEWVDAMVRIEGIASHVLGTIVRWDEALEIGKSPPDLKNTYYPVVYPESDTFAQLHVVPSGPDNDRETLQKVLLMAIYESQEELIISTPYFIPDEPLVTAIKSAALRGVKVVLLVPKKNNSKMVYYASRSYYDEIMASGVEIHQFMGGLLHTKCVLIDRCTALFGTVNLDMRSVWLNFEVTLVIYDSKFGSEISELMKKYIRQSVSLNRSQWRFRSVRQRLLENTAQLLAPLL